MNMTISKDRFLLALFIILFFPVAPFFLRASEIKDDTVIAVVDGKEIIYKQIKINPVQIKYMQLKYVNTHKGKEMTIQELEQVIRDTERGTLISLIRKIIKEQVIKELGITVSQKEIDRSIQDMTRIIERTGISEDQSLKEVQERTSLIAKALKAWQKNPNKSEQIYKKLLEPEGVTSYEWQVWRVAYDTPDKLDKLQKSIPKTVDDLRKLSYSSAERDIIYRKLRDIVGKEASVSEDETEDYYKKLYGVSSEDSDRGMEMTTETVKELKRQLEKELLEKKKYAKEQEWWQEQYKKARIEIKDERFKDVLEMLIPSAGKELKKEIKP